MPAMKMNSSTGTVEGIAYRPVDGSPMQPLDECEVLAGRGLALENRQAGKREITLLSAERWGDACRELGVEVPWTLRRANLLIRGVDLASAIGRIVTLGPVRALLHGETRPCGIMDSQHAGLRAALVPELRGGVHAEVLRGGIIRKGDRVLLET